MHAYRVSPNTWNWNRCFTVTFKKHEEATLITLVHSGLLNHELARVMKRLELVSQHVSGGNSEMARAGITAGKEEAIARQN